MTSHARKICLSVALALLPPGLAFAECNGSSWTPDSRYQIRGDEVLDITSKLTWKRCANGMAWNGRTCKGDHVEVTWTDAVRTLPVRGKGWRVPSKHELATLLSGEQEKRAGCWNPAINTTVFPGGQGTYFWSSSAYEGDASIAWVVMFEQGEVDSRFRHFTYALRLVRDSR